jgi:hypothetical protein
MLAVFTYLVYGGLLLWIVIDHVVAVCSGQDPDAKWHLVAFAVGMLLAVLVEVFR